ncbi:hypothetical protein V493_03264 [Pseudogymnoascus sp. VKM F-4281 (FW-2241)]|nr:hypothetical protein V493_03264 [Pseudogymnoascus sp. VKM F-4281 (FW-2241)]
MEPDTDTSRIRDWRSIVTLLVFIITNCIVLFPFHIPVYVPRPVSNAFLDTLSKLRIISPRSHHDSDDNGKVKPFVRLSFPMNFVTAPLIADLFLLAILAIGRKEVHDGTLGTDNISPIDIMAFFITLAYIAISIDASGLIRFLAFKVLQKGGKVGHRLFFYLYAFFFGLGTFIGNDPIILSGTAFLAYMTRVSSNIIHPRAWIHSQFAIANISSAILVSSNPTNLVLAGAFNIKFINYTANMIVPVFVTAIVLFPFLLYIIFADESLIPLSIKMHELSEEAKLRKPANPNIPHSRGNVEEEGNMAANDEQANLLSLEEIMNPFLDKGGAAFGAAVMGATLVTVLALNAASQSGNEHPVYWVTVPGAFVMFCWDLGFGWYHREETRSIARKGRQEVEAARTERAIREAALGQEDPGYGHAMTLTESPVAQPTPRASENGGQTQTSTPSDRPASAIGIIDEKGELDRDSASKPRVEAILSEPTGVEKTPPSEEGQKRERATLTSLTADAYRWCQETFPTVTAVMAHLPFALVPFAFTMFILVQALVTKGWVSVFAYGWDHWVSKTGTVGAIGGMGFLSVVLSNFAGTNIGTTILLCRVVQAWTVIHDKNQIPITDRTFWATVYGMAIGVNYGAFSTAFSASLAGLLWKDILARKHIHVKRLDFARAHGDTLPADQLHIPPMKNHKLTVEKIAASVQGYFKQRAPFRINHGSTNSTRQAFQRQNTVDISALSRVLKVDTKTRTALVEPNVPMDRLVEATIKYGLIPPVVMEFPGITAGGGFAGTGGESSSFKFGYFNETVNSAEVVLGNGDVVTASEKENVDLFHGASGAVGSLGISTLLEIQLIEAKKYVKATYHTVKSVPEAVKKVREETENAELDYVDGILFSKNHGAIVTGTMTDDLPVNAQVQTFSDARDPWFYLHVQDKTKRVAEYTEYIPLAEYLFRYDRGGFWVGASAFKYFKFPFNWLTRWWLDDFLHTRMLYKALHASGQSRNYVVQDLALPYSKAEEFIDYTADSFNIWPLWLCPLRQTCLPTLHPHNPEMEADGKSLKPMLNVGLWGFGPAQRDKFVTKNRELEHKLRDLGGMKWHYAHTYYEENEFWKMFDRKWYDGLREKYHAETLPSVWHKVKVDPDAAKQADNSSWGKWALQFWPLGGIWGLRKSIESRDYLIARNSTWKSKKGTPEGR